MEDAPWARITNESARAVGVAQVDLIAGRLDYVGALLAQILDEVAPRESARAGHECWPRHSSQLSSRPTVPILWSCSRSASTIKSISSSKLVRGSQPSFSFAFV